MPNAWRRVRRTPRTASCMSAQESDPKHETLNLKSTKGPETMGIMVRYIPYRMMGNAGFISSTVLQQSYNLELSNLKPGTGQMTKASCTCEALAAQKKRRCPKKQPITSTPKSQIIPRSTWIFDLDRAPHRTSRTVRLAHSRF